MSQENESLCPYHRHYEQFKVFEEYFVAQYQLLYELIELIDKLGRPERLNNLGVLLFSLITNAESIVKLISGGFIPEGYLISRSFFEKCVNFCYLNVCDEEEYDNHLSWTHQKIVRSLYTKQKAFKIISKEMPLPEISVIVKEISDLKKFTGKKGGEKPNWTKVSIYQRINFIKKKVDIFTYEMYLVAMNVIYEDASENIHGTLYGATFHTGVLYGKKKKEDKTEYLISLGLRLFMFLGLLINGIFEVISIIISADELLKKSKDNFKNKIQNFYNDAKNPLD